MTTQKITPEMILDYIDKRLKPLLNDDDVGLMVAAENHREGRAILQYLREMVEDYNDPNNSIPDGYHLVSDPDGDKLVKNTAKPDGMRSAEDWMREVYGWAARAVSRDKGYSCLGVTPLELSNLIENVQKDALSSLKAQEHPYPEILRHEICDAYGKGFDQCDRDLPNPYANPHSAWAYEYGKESGKETEKPEPVSDEVVSEAQIDFSQFQKDQHYDVESFFNLREWLQKILEKEGCVITDSGLGMGAADLGFKHQGAQYGVSIWPRIEPKPPSTGGNSGG
jgi:hypothetical protein